MEFLTGLVKLVPGAAIPLVVVILGLYWIYRKTESINKDREDTKLQRDKDSQNVHDELLRHSFEITNLKGITDLHKDRLNSIDHQLTLVNEQLVRLNMSVEHLSASLKEQNEIMKEQLKKGKA